MATFGTMARFELFCYRWASALPSCRDELTLFISAACIAIDSYFWRQAWYWPELQSLLFNVVEGHSEAWGIEPWHAYFTRHLPKILLLSYPPAILSAIGPPKSRMLAAPALCSVALVSQLKHKEWRFVIYAVPLLSAACLRTTNAMCVNGSQLPEWFTDGSSTSVRQWPKFRLLALMALGGSTLMATSFSTFVSHHNYPGGEAMALLHSSQDLTCA